MSNNYNTPVSVECLIDKKAYMDFSKFHRFYVRRASGNLILFPVMLIAFAIFNWYLGNNGLGWILLSISIFIPIWSLGAFYTTVNKQVKIFQLDNPRVFYSITFPEEGIHVNNQKEQVDYKWKQVYKIYRTRNGIYLYLTPFNAFIIPMDSIKNHELDKLWVLFQKHVAGKRLKIIGRRAYDEIR